MSTTSTTPLHRLAAAGQSIWLDALSRDLIRSGELERLVAHSAVTGVTSNPTIFEQALTATDAYDEQLNTLADADPERAFLALAVADVQAACDVLAPVYAATGGLDGFVSLEVAPRLADDIDGTLAQARELRSLVERPNLMVKIPATDAGVVAFEEAVAEGMAINMTLIFGMGRHREVAEAYVRGIERFVEAGGRPVAAPSVASLFVSRVDTLVDAQLEAAGAPTGLRGKAAIANAKLAHLAAGATFAGPRWEALACRGARPQRSLWASTSVKDPRLCDVRYVEGLVGSGTVTTMPLATLAAFGDHGTVALTLDEDLDGARQLLHDVVAAGVDLESAFERLEAEGVARFADSHAAVLAGIAGRRTTPQPAR